MDIDQNSLARSGSQLALGSVFWVLCVQYYVVQVIAALAWKLPFSLAQNSISDLGNTVCGAYGSRVVCSPLHGLMNASFVVLGLLMAVGAFLIYLGLPWGRLTSAGLACLAIAGLGTILVGAFPENTVSALHIVGAALPFAVGNIGLVFLGLAAGIPKWLRWYALISGIVALLALAFFLTNNYLGLGLGGLERLVAYPQTIG